MTTSKSRGCPRKRRKKIPETPLCEQRNMQVVWVPLEHLSLHPNNPRKHSRRQINILAKSITRLGWMNPILADGCNRIIAGAGRFEAAKKAGLKSAPVIRIEGLSEDEILAYVIADNRIAELSTWDDPILDIGLKHIVRVDIDLAMSIGFETPELDFRLGTEDAVDVVEEDEESLQRPEVPVSKLGDKWLIGPHTHTCGDARNADAVKSLVGDHRIRLVVEDRPYNVPVGGHVSGLGRKRHKEFAMASGEMSHEEFQSFLKACTEAHLPHLVPGALSYQFIDWRGLEDMLASQRSFFGDLHNLAVWVKTSAGMGSHYRSQHELCCIHKHGTGSHVNNVQLGRFGRYRSNVWMRAGANVFRAGRDEDLDAHPTVKPLSLIGDIILDSSNIGDCVLDCFAGSGSTLLACHRTQRVGFGMEIDPGFVDVALGRLMAATELPAVLEATGQTFEEVARERLGYGRR